MAAHAKSATSVRVYNGIHSHKRHPLRPHFRPTLRPMPSWGSLSHMSSRRDLRVAHGQAGSAASDTNVRGSVSATAQRCHPFYGPHRRAACGGVRFMRSVLSVSASAQVRGGVRGTLSGRASVRLHGIDLCLGVCVWGGGAAGLGRGSRSCAVAGGSHHRPPPGLTWQRSGVHCVLKPCVNLDVWSGPTSSSAELPRRCFGGCTAMDNQWRCGSKIPPQPNMFAA